MNKICSCATTRELHSFQIVKKFTTTDTRFHIDIFYDETLTEEDNNCYLNENYE